jgi:hypothetical protein
MLCCNNKRALELLSHHLHHIRPSAKCADICHSLKTTKPLLNGAFQYVHVYGHMDQYLKWEQLMLTQQLNCVCNMLAKKSITTATIHGYHDRQSQLLLKKDEALVIWGNKITGNILPPLQFHASKEVARKYLATRKKDKWSNKRFKVVASIMGSLRSNKRMRKPGWCNIRSRYYVRGYILSLLLALQKDSGHSTLIPKGLGTHSGAQPGHPVATLLW